MYIRRNHSALRIKRSWDVMLNGKTTSLIALLLVGGTTQAIAQSAAREPSETEMRAALQAKLDGARKMTADMAAKCKNPQTPIDAMMCLMSSSYQMGANSLSIGGFKKIGCERANRGGYWCDYMISMNTPLEFSNSGVTSKRFVNNGGQWVSIDE